MNLSQKQKGISNKHLQTYIVISILIIALGLSLSFNLVNKKKLLDEKKNNYIQVGDTFKGISSNLEIKPNFINITSEDCFSYCQEKFNTSSWSNFTVSNKTWRCECIKK